jgi:N-acetylglucosaminyl-diphospho-decaprenol L-rhamnosyltransferase
LIDLTIVIPSYETHDLLLSCLCEVGAARKMHPELSVETIVVDNGSRDGSIQAVAREHPDVRLVALVRNVGFAAAVNRGLAAGQGRIVLLLNSDVEIDADLLIDGVRLLDAHPEVGVVGAALFHPDGRPQRSAHRLPDLATEWLPEFLLGRFRPMASAPTRKRGSSAVARFERVEAVRGAVFMFRASLLDEVGPFDEGFFFFLEETEFCARVRRAGYQIVRADDMKAVHRLGASSKKRAPLATRIEFHRSLYRYLEIEQGRWTARWARATRGVRGAALVFGLAVLAPISSRHRRQLSERWGLFLWHLRGCPPEPRLVDVLAADCVTCSLAKPRPGDARRRMKEV